MPKTKNPLDHPVYIEWHDAKGVHQRWEHLEEYMDEPPNYIVHSVGFVLRESKTVLHIAAHVHRDEEGDIQFCGDIQVPKKMIIDLWDIT